MNIFKRLRSRGVSKKRASQTPDQPQSSAASVLSTPPENPQPGALDEAQAEPGSSLSPVSAAAGQPAGIQDAISLRGSLPTPSRETSAADISFRMWNAAYQAVKSKDAKLVETYERVVSQQIDGGDPAVDIIDHNALANCSEEERLRRMESAVSRCVEKAKKHESFRDGVIQTSAVIVNLNKVVSGFLTPYPPAAMAWSGICTVLPMLTSPLVANQTMVKGLQHVASRMDWYMDLSTILLEHSWERSDAFSRLSASVEQRIVDLYQEALQFEMWSVAWCFQDHAVAKGLKTMVGLVDWEARRNDIEKIEATLDQDLAQYASREIVRQMRGIAEQQNMFYENVRQVLEKQQKTAYEIAGRFKTTDYEGRLKFNPVRVPGTCEWFEKHEKFKEWQRQDTGILLLSADPGCGKSVLARYLVETIIPRDSTASTICYFFFKDTEEQKSLKNALCALLHQLFLSKPLLAKACKGMIESQGEMISSDVTGLWKIFTEAAKKVATSQLICVLDALDECDPADFPTLVEFLRGFSSTRNAAGDQRPRVKFLVTTRGYPEIIDELLAFESTLVHLSGDSKDEKDQIQKEIGLVVDQKLTQLSSKKNLSDERQLLIRNALEDSGEQRTYLWVSLVFQVLERNFNDTRSEWQKLISNPPKTVFSAYAKLLERINLVEKNKVRVLLNLIIVANRPLTLQEMNTAIHIHEHHKTNSEADLDLMPENSFRKWLIHTCGFFVTEYNKKVFFIHQTAKEFLLRDSHKSNGELHGTNEWQSSVTIEQAHQSMAESCIAYLSLNDFASCSFRGQLSEFLQRREWGPSNDLSSVRDEFCETFSQHKLLDYATRHWTSHFQSAQRVEGEDVVDIDPEYFELYWSLFDAGDTITQPWLSIWELIQNPRRAYDYRLVNIPGTEQKPCLYSGNLLETISVASVAALLGHQRLLCRCFSRSAQSVTERTGPSDHDLKLMKLWDERHHSFRRLSRRLEDPSSLLAPPEGFAQPFFFSLVGGHGSSFDYCVSNLDSGQLNCTDLLNRTLLHIAVLYGQYAELELLVKYGVDVNAVDVAGLTALDYFVRLGRSEKVEKSKTEDFVKGIKLLIQSGTKYNPALGGSLLHLAAEAEWGPSPRIPSTLPRLQLSGIHDADSLDGAYHQSFIKFLLEHGEQIDYRDFNGDTPLHSACRAELTWNVLCLLRGNADTNLSDVFDMSPLHYVCMNGEHEDGIVSSALLQYGALIDAPDYNSKTPIMYACRHGSLHSVRVLVDHGANLEVRDRNGYSALEHAAFSGEYTAAKLLLDRGADRHATDNQGNTGLHLLCSRRDFLKDRALETLKFLVQSGIEVNSRNVFGRTALHSLCTPSPVLMVVGSRKTLRGRAMLVAFLLDNGADVNIRDISGKSPLDYAVKHMDDVSVKLLQERGTARTTTATTAMNGGEDGQ